MMRSRYVMDALRRDVSFVWHTVIAVVFIGFAGLAVAAALLDLRLDQPLGRSGRRIAVPAAVEILDDEMLAAV